MTSASRRQFFAQTAAIASNSVLPSFARSAEPAVGAADGPIDIGNRLELFIDDTLIGSLQGVEQRMHHPVPQAPALVLDCAWEGNSSGYFSIFQDSDRYRCYYRGSQMKLSDPPAPSFSCYAESDDGITWRKPELGLVEFNGSSQNNIVLSSGNFAGIAAPIDAGHLAFFRDDNPHVSPEAQYKALIGVKDERSLLAFRSADGLHWKPLSSKPILTGGQFDSQNTAFWDPVTKLYRVYARSWNQGNYQGGRGIRTATSPDFLQWSEFVTLDFPGADPKEQLYTNVVKPYARAPHILVGFPMRYIERGWSESMSALPEPAEREKRAKIQARYGMALTDSLLMSSRDGRTFHRFAESFLRPGPERPGTWQYGNQSIAWHVVETRSALDPNVKELSLYALERYWHGPGSVLRRYTLRLDGFVSLHAPLRGGEFVTKPLKVTGRHLCINFATSAAGSIRVELQDEGGRPMEGFTLADSNEIFGDALARPLTWKKGADVTAWAGKPIRIRFHMNDADVFALQATA